MRNGKPLAVSYGGGDNSFAMLLLFEKRGIRPDFIAMADTGGEKPRTYWHLENVAKPWVLKTWGIEIETTRKLFRKEFEGLEGQCLRHSQMPSLAYGHRSCSQKYKHEMLERALADFMRSIDEIECNKAIGYHAMEANRVNGKPLNKCLKYGVVETYWYPLVEWNIRGEDCRRIILEAGFEAPGKSACFFCPAMKPSEVFKLRDEHPDLLARALEIEDRAQTTNTTPRGLGGAKQRWRDWLNKDEAQMKMLLDIEPMHAPCGCMEG